MTKSKTSKRVDLSIKFCGCEFENPFLLSSGPSTARVEMIERAFAAGWAGAVTKALGLDPRPNPHPRIAALRFERKIIGLENIESVIYPLDRWLPKISKLKRKYPEKILIPNLMGGVEAADWQKMTKMVQEAGADIIELNLSCPLMEEVRTVGATVGQDPRYTFEVVKSVKEVAEIPVMVKLTPNVTDITSIAKAVEKGGGDALSAINTVLGFIGVDLEKMEPKPQVRGKSAFGGFSGPAVKPIALRSVAQIAKATKLPVSGIGGISGWEDAMEFFMVGASTVQLCTTVMLKGYRIIDDLKAGTANYLSAKGFGSVKSVVGQVLPKIRSLEKLDFEYWALPKLEPSKCVKCGLCELSCRDAGYEAIELDEGQPVFDLKKCDSCGLCVQVCPAQALALEPRE